MEKIKFTSGTMQKFGEFYELQLFNKEGKKVYAATLPTSDAAAIIDKYDNIKMI